MRYSAIFLFLAVPVFGQAPFTQKMADEGWLQLFDGESTFGWIVEGEASVKDGVLTLGGTKASKMRTRVLMNSFEVRYSRGMGLVKIEGGLESGIHFEDRTAGLVISTRNQCVEMSVPAGKSVAIRTVHLRPTKMASLFNGKDLSGWKVYPGTKDKKVSSKYSVTKEGWLNVKDGPGDLQTEGQWANFVVQLECISNGKHLNSGLFFRCQPDLYQQGYEAQIRNEWTGNDRTKPVDFGTGAIYRRQPARKVVSTDGEWFTLTVAAHGRDIATWVNGFPVVAWADDRKEADNARQGFKKGKGSLSIQGHDPTTDLSFRNLRIQSLD